MTFSVVLVLSSCFRPFQASIRPSELSTTWLSYALRFPQTHFLFKTGRNSSLMLKTNLPRTNNFFPYFLFYAFALYTHANHVHYNHTPPPTTLECLRHVALYIYVSIFIPSFLAPFNQFVLYDLCLVFLQLQRILKYLVSLFSPAYVYSFAKAKRIRVYTLIFTLA